MYPFLQAEDHARAVVGKVFTKMTQQSLSQSWRAWREYVAQSVYEAEMLQRSAATVFAVLTKLSQQSLSKAWRAWRQAASADALHEEHAKALSLVQRSAALSMQRIVRRLRTKKVTAAWRTWRQCHEVTSIHIARQRLTQSDKS